MYDMNKAFEAANNSKELTTKGYCHLTDDGFDYVAIDHYNYISVVVYVKGTVDRVDSFHIHHEH